MKVGTILSATVTEVYSVLFPSIVRQMPRNKSQIRGTARHSSYVRWINFSGI